MKAFLKNNALALAILAALILFGLDQFPQLPDQVPIHFDLQGHPNGYSSKAFALWFLPALILWVIALIYGLVRVSPEQYNMPNSLESVGKLNSVIVLMLGLIQVGIILNARDPGTYGIQRFIILAFATFLLGGGNFMSKVERNYFIGVRTPWTLASEENWHATHRFAARAMVLGGVLLFAASFITQSVPVALGVLVLSVSAPVIYSYAHFVRHARK